MVVTESWLTTNITDDPLDPKGQYTIYRNDRSKCAGGICAFVDRRLSSANVDLQIQTTPLEMLCFDVYGYTSTDLYRVFAVYRPPESSYIYTDIDHVDYIQQVLHKIELFTNRRGPAIVIGDFNCPNIDWSTMTAPFGGAQSILCDFCISNSYVQLVNEATRGDHILDIVLIRRLARQTIPRSN